MEDKALSEDIIRCLGLFRNATTDNERLASLMLIAKMSKSNELGLKARRKIYNSIGFDFITRLLSTDKEDDDMLRHVAVALLACYCTDPELALHPQVTSKLILLNKYLSSPSSAPVLVQDSLHCLMCLVQNSKGAEYIWKYRSLRALFDCFISHREAQQDVKAILHRLLTHADLVIAYGDQLDGGLGYIIDRFKESQDQLKFDICSLLIDIFSLGIVEVQQFNHWFLNMGMSLNEILQSKLDSPRRQMALNLCGAVCQQYGAEWILSVNEKFLLLLTHLASIEIQLLLKDIDSDPSLIIISCFIILESVIILMANQEEKEGGGAKDSRSMTISEEGLIQLHSTLLESQLAVVRALRTQMDNDGQSTGTRDHHSTYLTAVVRFLGAWLAEDSLSLSEELYSLLPYLLKLCDTTATDTLKFLLPGLSNLVTDHKPRKILVDNGLTNLLLHHIINESGDTTADGLDQVVSCCSVMLTLLLSDTTVLCHGQTTQWLSRLAAILKKESHSSKFAILVHLSLLYLIILKQNDGTDLASNAGGRNSCSNEHGEVITGIVEILAGSLCLMKHDLKTWDSVNELWHISMQEIRNFFGERRALVQHLLNNKHPFKQFMDAHQGVTGSVSPECEAVSLEIARLYQTMTEIKHR